MRASSKQVGTGNGASYLVACLSQLLGLLTQPNSLAGAALGVGLGVAEQDDATVLHLHCEVEMSTTLSATKSHMSITNAASCQETSLQCCNEVVWAGQSSATRSIRCLQRLAVGLYSSTPTRHMQRPIKPLAHLIVAKTRNKHVTQAPMQEIDALRERDSKVNNKSHASSVPRNIFDTILNTAESFYRQTR